MFDEIFINQMSPIDAYNYGRQSMEQELKQLEECEYNKGRADVIDEISKAIDFEEKWLSSAIREDKGNYDYNIDIAFSGIKIAIKQLKEQL